MTNPISEIWGEAQNRRVIRLADEEQHQNLILLIKYCRNLVSGGAETLMNWVGIKYST